MTIIIVKMNFYFSLFTQVRVNALIRRATLHQHSGDTKKREEDFQAAVAIDENNPDIYHHWGQVIIFPYF